MQQSTILQNVRYNFTVNVADGMFFGLGLGFASSTAIFPLFFATLTDNLTVIGFVAALHTIGWALPQMFTAQYVARMRRYKPFVLLMTIHERWPFFGLALVALVAPHMNQTLVLWLALLLLAWHSFGGGVTGTAWQSMIGKIMPPNRRGTFYGFQSAGANLMLSGGAIAAGLLLERIDGPVDFALCFLLAGLSMIFSYGFLSMTREQEMSIANFEALPRISWRSFITIVKKDGNFRWFLLARVLSQVAIMALSFYTIYATRHLGMDAATSGVMVGVMALAQTGGNLLLGWVGDQFGHRKVLVFGAAMVTLSPLVAMFAPTQHWFYLVFGLTGVANATLWATAMAMTIEFGTDAEKPLYIGVTNTAMAIPAIIAPLIGGWLADAVSFQATFLISVVSGLLTMYLLFFVVRDSRSTAAKLSEQTVEAVA